MKHATMVVGILAVAGVGALVFLAYQHQRAAALAQLQAQQQAQNKGGGGPMDQILGLATGASVALSGILSDKRVQGGIASGAQALGSAAGEALKGAFSSFGGG